MKNNQRLVNFKLKIKYNLKKMKKILISFIFLISINGIFSHDASALNELLKLQANSFLSSDSDYSDNYRNSVNENIMNMSDIESQIYNSNRDKSENGLKLKRGHIWKRMVRKIYE